MALIKGTIPVVDEYLIKAVKYALDQLGIHPDNLPQKKRRTSLDGVGYGGASSYNGYFTIKLRKLEDGTQKIVVCDGATYDAEKHTSGHSTVRVGGAAFRVDYFETNIRQGNYLVFLKYTAGSMDVNGNVTQNSKIEICVEENSDIALNSGDATFLIGDVNFQDGTVTVIQRFQGQPEQTPYITWYVSCRDFTDYILSEKSTEVVIQ